MHWDLLLTGFFRRAHRAQRRPEPLSSLVLHPSCPLQTVAVAVAADPAQSQEFQASPRRPVAVAAVYEVYEHPQRLLHQHEMRAHLHHTHQSFAHKVVKF
eukprot:COSAG01_NODE_27_length_36706_cov_155.674106_23_plen_100_part_00